MTLIAIWRCCRDWPLYPLLPVGRCGYCGERPEPTDRTLEEYLGACQECGNDDPTEGYRVCLDCLEELG